MEKTKMLDEQTHHKMLAMKMNAMAEAFLKLLQEAPSNQSSFGEKVAQMIDREWLARENRRLSRLLRAAKLTHDAAMEDVWTTQGARCYQGRRARAVAMPMGRQSPQRHLRRQDRQRQELPRGCAQAACRNGHRSLYKRVPRLMQELAIARADGSYSRVLARLAKVHVLVLDDLLIAPLKDAERRDLLEILEDRYDRSSTVITSQLPTGKWHAALGDPTVADAICDRVVHNAHVINLAGPSGRKRKGLKTKT